MVDRARENSKTIQSEMYLVCRQSDRESNSWVVVSSSASREQAIRSVVNYSEQEDDCVAYTWFKPGELIQVEGCAEDVA